MVIPRLIARIRVLDESCRRACFLRIGNQFNRRHFLENKIRQCRLMYIVGSVHLNAHPDALAIFLRQIKNKFQVIGQLETSSSRLDLAPRRAYVELLPQWKSNQVLNRLRNVVRFDLLRSEEHTSELQS